MRKHQTYKHEENTDVAIYVLRVIDVKGKPYIKVKVSWMNIVNPENIYPCGIVEEIKILRADLRKWKVYSKQETIDVSILDTSPI